MSLPRLCQPGCSPKPAFWARTIRCPAWGLAKGYSLLETPALAQILLTTHHPLLSSGLASGRLRMTTQTRDTAPRGKGRSNAGGPFTIPAWEDSVVPKLTKKLREGEEVTPQEARGRGSLGAAKRPQGMVSWSPHWCCEFTRTEMAEMLGAGSGAQGQLPLRGPPHPVAGSPSGPD